MTDREALERALEALREIDAAEVTMSKMLTPFQEVERLQDLAKDTLNEIQRGRWIATVSPTPREAVIQVGLRLAQAFEDLP